MLISIGLWKPLFWLSVEGKTTVLATAAAFSSNICSLSSNFPSFKPLLTNHSKIFSSRTLHDFSQLIPKHKLFSTLCLYSTNSVTIAA